MGPVASDLARQKQVEETQHRNPQQRARAGSGRGHRSESGSRETRLGAERGWRGRAKGGTEGQQREDRFLGQQLEP